MTDTLIPATTKQLSYLADLLSNRPCGVTDIPAFMAEAAKLSKSEVSKLISTALAVRPTQVVTHDPNLPLGVTPGRVECANSVPGAAPQSAPAARKASTVTNAPNAMAARLGDVEDGYYAIPSKTGNNDLDFIRVHTNQGRSNPANKGKRYISRIIGGDGQVQITYTEQTTFAGILAGMSRDQQTEALAVFGREFKHCGRCHLPLTDEDSRYTGLGRDCAGHRGVPYGKPKGE